jgi:hypothetical protein
MGPLIRLFVLGVAGFSISIMGINALSMAIVKAMVRLIIKLPRKSLPINFTMTSIRLGPVRKAIDIDMNIILFYVSINALNIY